MGVYVAAGQVASPTANNTGSVLCTSDAQEAVNLNPAPPSGTDRYDVIICRPRGQDLDGGANDDFIFDFVSGTAAASPTVPAIPAGTVALANVRIRGGAATVAAADVADVRPHGLALAGGAARAPYTGTGIGSYVAPDGEVWVAKATVSGGAWKRARDMLHCYCRFTGSLTLSASDQLVICTGVDFDPLTIYNPSTGFLTIPVAGKWRITTQTSTSATAAGQNLSNKVYVNGAARFYAWTHSAFASAVAMPGSWAANFGVGDTVGLYTNLTSGTPLVRNDGSTSFGADYLGTG